MSSSAGRWVWLSRFRSRARSSHLARGIWSLACKRAEGSEVPMERMSAMGGSLETPRAERATLCRKSQPGWGGKPGLRATISGAQRACALGWQRERPSEKWPRPCKYRPVHPRLGRSDSEYLGGRRLRCGHLRYRHGFGWLLPGIGRVRPQSASSRPETCSQGRSRLAQCHSHGM